jgi:hypothetical protein
LQWDKTKMRTLNQFYRFCFGLFDYGSEAVTSESCARKLYMMSAPPAGPRAGAGAVGSELRRSSRPETSWRRAFKFDCAFNLQRVVITHW